MKNRLFAFIESTGLSMSDFAEITKISNATLTGIKTNRTRPTLEIITKIKTAYPRLRTDWLLYGTGSMWDDTSYNNTSAADSGDAFMTSIPSQALANISYPSLEAVSSPHSISQGQQGIKPEKTLFSDQENNCNFRNEEYVTPVIDDGCAGAGRRRSHSNEIEQESNTKTKLINNPDLHSHKISRVIVFYDDNTYEEIFK